MEKNKRERKRLATELMLSEEEVDNIIYTILREIMISKHGFLYTVHNFGDVKDTLYDHLSYNMKRNILEIYTAV